MKKSLLVGLGLSFMLASVSAQAQRQARLQDQVQRKSERLANRINNNINQFSVQELRDLNELLTTALQVVRDSNDDGRPGPGPRPNPPGRRNNYQATCHIDDDRDFTYGQQIIGTLSSPSVDGLLADCAAFATNSYGARGSYGLKDLKALNMDRTDMKAECHIDDDRDFTAGQFVVGEVVGQDTRQLVAQCEAVGNATFRSQASSGLLRLNDGLNAPRGYVSGQCHIDDDRDFTPGQTVVGLIWSSNVQDLIDQCAHIAQSVYNGRGSSGVQNIR
ncbi:MAG: hypothetical protein CL675_12985 [Bdellovibrionaceae bacterium]|nr:hypothetical protein [Pseudobdellovibrionaceae bacterium]